MPTTVYITHRRMEQSFHGGKHVGWVLSSDGTKYSRNEVLSLLRQGVAVYTYVEATGHQARVHPLHCGTCGATYLTTVPDIWQDDNLDHLPYF